MGTDSNTMPRILESGPELDAKLSDNPGREENSRSYSIQNICERKAVSPSGAELTERHQLNGFPLTFTVRAARNFTQLFLTRPAYRSEGVLPNCGSGKATL